MMGCNAPSYGDPFVTGLLDYIDCQTQAIASGGYQALASPASIASPWMAGLLTIFVAVIGLRMLAGHMPGIGDLLAATLKVGVALTLATSWAAYRTVVYDPVLKAPAQLTHAIGAPADLPGADGGLIARLQAADDAIVRLTDLGAGRLDKAPIPREGEAHAPIPPRAPVADDFAFGLARLAFLIGMVGVLGAMRLASGILLALAPIFAGLLLFEATRTLFFGWLRALFAASLGAMLVTTILAVELGVLEPWLVGALAQREAYYAIPAAPAELLALTVCFALILVVVTGFATRLAMTATAPNWSRWISREQPAIAAQPSTSRFAFVPATPPASASFDRAEHLASRLGAEPARTSSRVPLQTLQSSQAEAATATTSQRPTARAPVPLGQSYRSSGSRVVAPRRSART